MRYPEVNYKRRRNPCSCGQLVEAHQILRFPKDDKVMRQTVECSCGARHDFSSDSWPVFYKPGWKERKQSVTEQLEIQRHYQLGQVIDIFKLKPPGEEDDTPAYDQSLIPAIHKYETDQEYWDNEQANIFVDDNA